MKLPPVDTESSIPRLAYLPSGKLRTKSAREREDSGAGKKTFQSVRRMDTTSRGDHTAARTLTNHEPNDNKHRNVKNSKRTHPIRHPAAAAPEAQRDPTLEKKLRT